MNRSTLTFAGMASLVLGVIVTLFMTGGNPFVFMFAPVLKLSLALGVAGLIAGALAHYKKDLASKILPIVGFLIVVMIFAWNLPVAIGLSYFVAGILFIAAWKFGKKSRPS